MNTPIFCPLPFVHTYIDMDGSVSACCRSRDVPMGHLESADLQTIWNSAAYQSVREQFRNGQWPSICGYCKDVERAGAISDRQRKIAEWPIENTDAKPSLSYVELKFSNICNLTCRMCWPLSSSSWFKWNDIVTEFRMTSAPDGSWGKSHQELIPRGGKRVLFDDFPTLAQDLLRATPHVQQFSFSGGEPLFDIRHFNFISSIAPADAKNIKLKYATNLTHFAPALPRLLQQWDKFREVDLLVSADGIYEIYDYIRVGATFENLIANLDVVKNHTTKNIRLGINFTLQAYNVFQVPQFLHFFENEMGIKNISINLLKDPDFLSCLVFPTNIRDQIATALSSSSSHPSVRRSYDWLMSEQKTALFETFQKYTRALDQRTQKDFWSLLSKSIDLKRDHLL